MGYKVLLVDDESDFRDLLAIYLKREGFETDCAENGKEAFDKIQTSRPDLVISDIRMPVWDGYELLKNVSQMIPPPIPMLFVSGYGSRNDTELTSSPNFAGLIAKPIKRQNLLDIIRGLQTDWSA
jgi:two-component system, OmpR family, response regulator